MLHNIDTNSAHYITTRCVSYVRVNVKKKVI